MHDTQIKRLRHLNFFQHECYLEVRVPRVHAICTRHVELTLADADPSTQTRQTNGFIEAINGWFQAAKRKARGFVRFATMRTVLFLIAGKRDFTKIKPHAA